MVVSLEQVKSSLRNLPAGAGGRPQFSLAAEGVQVLIPNRDLLHRAAGHQLPHPGGDAPIMADLRDTAKEILLVCPYMNKSRLK